MFKFIEYVTLSSMGVTIQNSILSLMKVKTPCSSSRGRLHSRSRFIYLFPTGYLPSRICCKLLPCFQCWNSYGQCMLFIRCVLEFSHYNSLTSRLVGYLSHVGFSEQMGLHVCFAGPKRHGTFKLFITE